MRAYLELCIATQQGYSEIINRTGIVRIEVSVTRLHDMVVRKPLHRRVCSLVDRGRVQCHRLVISDVAPAFAFARQKLRIETPGDDRIDHDIIAAIEVELLWDSEELAVSAVGARAV